VALRWFKSLVANSTRLFFSKKGTVLDAFNYKPGQSYVAQILKSYKNNDFSVICMIILLLRKRWCVKNALTYHCKIKVKKYLSFIG